MTGTGTQADPFILTTVDDLYLMSTKGSKSMYFKLGNDIDFNGTQYMTEFKSIPLLCASFDGDGHAIRNIQVYNTGSPVTLFSVVNTTMGSVTVKMSNLVLENITLAGKEVVVFGGTVKHSILLNNCDISISAMNSTVVSNVGSNPAGSIISGDYSTVNLESTTLVMQAELHLPHPFIFGGYIKNSQIRLDMTFLEARTIEAVKEAVFTNVEVSNSYLFGTMNYKGESETAPLLVSNGGTFSNFYQVVEYSGFKDAYWNSSFATTCFYDRNLLGDAEIKFTADAVAPENFHGLTTEQCKDVDYLQSIHYSCLGKV